MIEAVGLSCVDHEAEVFVPLRAALSDNVKDKPVGVEILGEKVVLFRESSGKVGSSGLHATTAGIRDGTRL